MTNNETLIVIEALAILETTMVEHDTADYGYYDENPWSMKEWFTDHDREVLARAKSLLFKRINVV